MLRLTKSLERYDSMAAELDDLDELSSLASDDGELDEIAVSLEPLKRQLERLEEAALFRGEYDGGDAVVTIHAGTGGTDAQDWTEMLLRMYLRWADDPASRRSSSRRRRARSRPRVRQRSRSPVRTPTAC